MSIFRLAGIGAVNGGGFLMCLSYGCLRGCGMARSGILCFGGLALPCCLWRKRR